MFCIEFRSWLILCIAHIVISHAIVIPVALKGDIFTFRHRLKERQLSQCDKNMKSHTDKPRTYKKIEQRD